MTGVDCAPVYENLAFLEKSMQNVIAKVTATLICWGVASAALAIPITQTIDTNGTNPDGSYATNFDTLQSGTVFWGHTFDTGLGSISSGTLTVSAFDLDTAFPTFAEVFVNGSNSLGFLSGANQQTSLTTLSLDAFTIAALGSGSVVNFQVQEINGPVFRVDFSTLEVEVESVPAPATLALFGLGLAGLGWKRRKQA